LDLKALRESMTNSLQLYVKTRHQAGTRACVCMCICVRDRWRR
jgi:hypothetical protein